MFIIVWQKYYALMMKRYRIVRVDSLRPIAMHIIERIILSLVFILSRHFQTFSHFVFFSFSK